MKKIEENISGQIAADIVNGAVMRANGAAKAGKYIDLQSDNSTKEYLDINGVAHANDNCVLTPAIPTNGARVLVPYFTIDSAGYCAKIGANGTTVLATFQVPAADFGKPIYLEPNVSFLRLGSFVDEANNPNLSTVAVLHSTLSEGNLSDRTASWQGFKSLDNWGGANDPFVAVEFPDASYSDGAIVNFKISVTDVPNTTAGPANLSATLKIGFFMMSTGAVKYQIENIDGDASAIISYLSVGTILGKNHLIISKPNNIGVKSYNVFDFSIFSSQTNEFFKKTFNIKTFPTLPINYIENFNLVGAWAKPTAASPFKNKVIALVGTSITAGYTNGVFLPTYTNLIKAKFDTPNVLNFGVSGGTLANGTHPDHIFSDTNINNIIAANPDYVIIEGGVNDYQTNQESGNPTSVSRSTTCGNLAYAIRTICAALPNARILYTTSTPYWFSLSGPKHSGRDVNVEGENLFNYFSSCIETCRNYGVPTLDAYSLAGWYDANEGLAYKFTTDGLHLATLGYDLWTTIMFNWFSKFVI